VQDDLAPDDPHLRPLGTSDATVEATGKLSEALEWVERARGHLYELHQLLGHADLTFGDAVEALRKAGHEAEADLVATEAVGRNVLPGRWTFQVVEEFEDTYWEPVREIERKIRQQLLDGRRHVYESEMKEGRRTTTRPDHEARP
jgi:hypothetical protein